MKLIIGFIAGVLLIGGLAMFAFSGGGYSSQERMMTDSEITRMLSTLASIDASLKTLTRNK